MRVAASITLRRNGRVVIRGAQIELLYEQLPPAIVASVVNAAILVAVFWKAVSQTLLLAWLLVILFVVLGLLSLLYLANEAARRPQFAVLPKIVAALLGVIYYATLVALGFSFRFGA